MNVIPVSFGSRTQTNVITSCNDCINKEYLAIPASMDKLVIALRTAYANELSLDKERTKLLGFFRTV